MTLREFARWSVITAASVAVLCPAAPVQAGALTVSPVILEFEAGQRALSTTVSNPGDRPMQVQVRLVRWSNAGDGETYTPTRDIGFSPPMFELKPGERQAVRLMVRTSPPPGREAAYRLIIDQLPEPGRPGVQMPVRMVLPVFVEPRVEGDGRLAWSATIEGGQSVVTAQNVGPRRVKLLDLTFLPDGSDAVRPGARGYVLAGESRTWRVPLRSGTGTVGVKARTQAGTHTVTLPLAPAS